MDIKEKWETERIKPEDLMWHLDATERELGEYYGASANAMNRITAIQSSVRLLLSEWEKGQKEKPKPMMEIKDVKYEPCISCVLLEKCLDMGDNTRCGYSFLFDDTFQLTQQLLGFMSKSRLRWWLYLRWKKNATINLTQYKKRTGHDWIKKGE